MLGRMVCAVFSSFWPCQKTDERNRVQKSVPGCRLTEGEPGGSKAIWAMPIWKQHNSKRGIPKSD